MDRLKQTKLNNLLAEWPAGVLLTSDWFNEHGYYRQLVKSYCDRGWIKNVGRGAYMRLNDEITWQGAVKALQSQLDFSVHVGGLTALQLYGVMQYVMLDDRNTSFYLYNTTFEKVSLPQWFFQQFTQCHLLQKKLFATPIGLSNKEIDGVQLSVSTPERAVLEMLALVPSELTLSYAHELIEGLNRLRSDVMQKLLEQCCSVRVKRLFLYLAEKNNLPCFNELTLERINLGSGNRVIGKGGVYSAKWLLSLPESDETNDQLESEDE